jgi:four helix bundle protein
MAEIRSYRDLRVWQEAMTLAEQCYRYSREFPRDEQFGLTSQLRRAAVSVPANIAEGYGRDTKGSYVNFLKIAQGSLKEVETHTILAQRLSFANATSANVVLEQCDVVGKMLRGLIRNLEGRLS